MGTLRLRYWGLAKVLNYDIKFPHLGLIAIINWLGVHNQCDMKDLSGRQTITNKSIVSDSVIANESLLVITT